MSASAPPDPSTPRRTAADSALAAYARLPATLLGKLASTGIPPAVVVLETLLLPVIAIALGWWASPEDPFWVHAPFPWTWLAPVILSLRYGPLAGLGGAVVVLAGWLALNIGQYSQFPQIYFLGGLIMVMLVGEFSSLWQARTRRAEITHVYLEQRMEHLVRQYYLLRLSHDRLEQELIGRPMSMRDALAQLHSAAGSAQGSAQGSAILLRLLAQYCQLESAAVYEVSSEGAPSAPLAQMGQPATLQPHDPLVVQALETNKLCHIGQVTAGQQTSQYLVAAPLLDLGGSLYGLLLVSEMPFFSLQEENLQTINLLLGYYTDGLATHALAQPIVAALPQCPPAFAFEVQRLAHVFRSTGIGSVIVALEFLPRAVERGLPEQILRLKRELDVPWLIEGGERHVLAMLMPLGSRATAEGYLARLEGWIHSASEQTLAQAGVSVHVIALETNAPLSDLQRIARIGQADA